MKVAKSAARVLGSRGVSAQSDFKILANAHSFRILSSGLYSDKISAVLREIGCNAIDSHIAAGCADRPIEVKLPTRLDSDFYIKDFGTGLSHQQILDLYTTYFSSNKGENNEQTGAFGLGSKSPFSYTDSFSVTSAHEGVQRSYSAFIGDTGAPSIALLDERPVSKDWPRGLLVSFPVAPKDITEFHDKAKEIFKWFEVIPVKAGSSTPLCETPEFRLSGSNFKFLGSLGSAGHSQDYWRNNGPKVISGNVAYPLDSERLGLLNQVESALLTAGIHLLMPLGSVMPTASREELEYDDRTRENLHIALEEAGREIAASLKQAVDSSAASEWQRKSRIKAFVTQLPKAMGRHIGHFVDLMSISKNKRAEILSLCLNDKCLIPAWIGDPRFDAGKPDESASSSANKLYSVFFIDVRTGKDGVKSVYKREVVRGKVFCGKSQDSLVIPYSREPLIVFANTKNVVGRAKAYALKENAPVIIVCPAGNQQESHVKAYAERVSASLGISKVVAASSLPRAAEKPSPGRTRGPALSRKEKSDKLDGTVIKVVLCGKKDFQIKELALRDIPETARFFIPRATDELSSIWDKHPVRSSVYWLLKALEILADNDFCVPRVTGFVLLKNTDLSRNVFLTRGFRSLPKTVDSILEDPQVFKPLRKFLNRLPVLDLAVNDGHCSNEGGLIGTLVELSWLHTGFRRWLNSALKQLPCTRKLFNELWAANAIDDKHRTVDAAARILISVSDRGLHKRLGLSCDKLMVAYERSMRKLYPMSEFIATGSYFYDFWKHNRKGAFEVLRSTFEV